MQVFSRSAQPAFLKQQHEARDILRHAGARAVKDRRRHRRVERQCRDLATPRRDHAPTLRRIFERPHRRQPPRGGSDRGGGRRVEPRHIGHVVAAPARHRQHRRGEVGGFDFGRIEGRTPSMSRRLPQTVGHARPLPRGTPGALVGGGLARPARDQLRGAGGGVVDGAPRQAAIDHHRHTVQRQRGLRDRRGQHDAPPPLRIARDRGALHRGNDLSMQRQDRHTPAARVPAVPARARSRRRRGRSPAGRPSPRAMRSIRRPPCAVRTAIRRAMPAIRYAGDGPHRRSRPRAHHRPAIGRTVPRRSSPT